MKRFSTAIGVILLVFAVTKAVGEETVPRTAIFVLVDISATWHNKSSMLQNQQILDEVNKAVLDLTAKVETPIAIYMLTIETDSVLNRPLCEAIYRKQLLNIRGKRSGEFSNRDELADYLELCRSMILSRPTSSWTDIHGALATVSQIDRGAAFQQRFLFILSDLKEERPKGDLPIVSLPAFRVATLYRVLSEDSRDPKGLQRRLEAWHSVLKKAGADRSIDAVDKTRFAGSVVRRLLSKDDEWK